MKSRETSGKKLFEEVQPLPLWLQWLMTLAQLSCFIVPVVIGIRQGMGIKEFWLVLVLLIVVEGPLIYLTWNTRFEKVLTTEGIYYRFQPLHQWYRNVGWNDIDSWYLRNSPALQIGYRLVPGYGTALTMNSGKGIQLQLKNGKRLFLGTADPLLMEVVFRQQAGINEKPH
jgi:hypothetical protein